MRTASRLAVALLLILTVALASPADAARRHHRHHHKRHHAHRTHHAAKMKAPARVAAVAPVDPHPGYQHTDQLDFDMHPDGSNLPVLLPHQHCSGFYAGKVIPYFGMAPVLICS